MKGRRAALWVSLGLIALGLTGRTLVEARETAGQTAESFDDSARVRLRSVRLRIQPREGYPAGACRNLGPQDLGVTVAGTGLDLQDRLVELDRTTRPTLHLLLLDVSRSMLGRLERVREVARDYIAQLDPRNETAILFSFDESVILVHGATDDVEALVEATRHVRMGGGTALHDGIYFAVREAGAHHERPVLVLLTDGEDTASHYRIGDLKPVVEEQTDMTLFTIGLGLPTPQPGSGRISTRRFLARSAREHDGRFFDVPSGTRLGRVFERIRDMVDDEATLVFLDPDPSGAPAPVQVESEDPRCKVRILRSREPGSEPPLETVAGGDGRYPYPPAATYRELPSRRLLEEIDPRCDGETARTTGEPWFIELNAGRVAGCGLDIALETGWLYTPDRVERMVKNHRLGLVTRPFTFDLPDPERLPTHPAAAMDSLAEFALSVAGEAPRIDIRRRPDRNHARPFHDYPGLSHGRTFLENREALAHALYQDPRYHAWIGKTIRRQAEAAFRRLVAQLREAVPDSDAAALEQAASESEAGRAILERTRSPTATDLRGHLAAWLGDISAHDLFVAWERQWADRILDGTNDMSRFVDGWIELRKIFFVPSYARVLTLLAPTYDPQLDRIGFWRVVLPRPGWLLQRLKGWENHVEYSTLPLDLIPDRPLGVRALQHLLASDAALAQRLRDGGYRVAAIEYRSLEKPYRRDARRAFNRAAVRLILQPEGESDAPRYELEAEVHLDKETREASIDVVRFFDEADAVPGEVARGEVPEASTD